MTRPKPSEIEYRVHQVIEALQQGAPVEDSLVEVKSKWPDEAFKAARRIAGHANAARGEPVLWIIGLDEQEGVTGADFNEFAGWWGQVESHFDQGVAPDPMPLNIPTEDGVVVAIHFETSRSPFVVKNPEGGRISREVPWRRATAVQSARRSDLIDLLVPVSRTPKVEVNGGTLTAADSGGSREWRVDLALFISPMADERIVLPWSHAHLLLRVGGGEYVDNLRGNVEIAARQVEHALTRSIPGLAIVDGPGFLNLKAYFKVSYSGQKEPAPDSDQYIRCSLDSAASLRRPIEFDATFEVQRLEGYGGVYRLKG